MAKQLLLIFKISRLIFFKAPALEVRRLFFDVLKPKCYDVIEKSRCVKFSTWFDQCLQEESFKVLDIRQA